MQDDSIESVNQAVRDLATSRTKKTEIAARVFAEVSSRELKDLEGGPLVVPVADLPGLMLVPWFCDSSIQWAIRLTSGAAAFKKTSLKKARVATVTITKPGPMLIGVLGDGIRPYLTSTFLPLSEGLPAALEPGTVLEVATANLGVVKLDEDAFKAETASRHGNQGYLGVIDPDRNSGLVGAGGLPRRAEQRRGSTVLGKEVEPETHGKRPAQCECLDPPSSLSN